MLRCAESCSYLIENVLTLQFQRIKNKRRFPENLNQAFSVSCCAEERSIFNGINCRKGPKEGNFFILQGSWWEAKWCIISFGGFSFQIYLKLCEG